VHIWTRVCRQPPLAGGDADGDADMLASARLALLLRHDDPARGTPTTSEPRKCWRLSASKAGRWPVWGTTSRSFV